ncbi:MAG: HAMP domain-containing sensor histidine kinase [Myxococcota bacterium]|nr:HAMP domain-containing sensor histidine kinase [Myxococcota bacterium]
MSLRMRIFSSIVVVVVACVGLAMTVQYRTATEVFEGELEERVRAIGESIRTEVAQRHEGLERTLEDLVETDRSLRRVLATGQDSELYGWARQHTGKAGMTLLKVIDERSVIRSSGHWPGSFGALDAGRSIYAKNSNTWNLVAEPTPEGVRLALEHWRAMTGAGLAGHRVIVGWFLKMGRDDRLAKMLARTGADLVAICSDTLEGGCLDAHSLHFPRTDQVRDWRQTQPEGLHLKRMPLLDGVGAPILVVGVHRGRLNELERMFWQRTAAVAGIGLLIALALGWFLAHGIGASLERLVQATFVLGEGQRGVRVESSRDTLPEMARLIEAFNTMASDLEASEGRRLQAERIATWQEIARSLAHELKNPLTPILGALKVVQRAHETQHAEFEAILEEQSGAVREEVHRLRDMADSFARFARLPEAVPGLVRIAELVDSVVSLYRVDCPAVEVTRVVESASLEVWADSAQLKIVFGNLLKNALEAMDGAGCMQITIESGPVRGRDGVWVRIEDDGCGIDPAVRDTLFAPYVSTKGERGTGLGLALVHRIVVEAGGQVDVEHIVPHGTAFKVWLPTQESAHASG